VIKKLDNKGLSLIDKQYMFSNKVDRDPFGHQRNKNVNPGAGQYDTSKILDMGSMIKNLETTATTSAINKSTNQQSLTSL